MIRVTPGFFLILWVLLCAHPVQSLGAESVPATGGNTSFSHSSDNSPEQPAPQQSSVSHPEDPWEGWNRKVFAFNEFFDRYLLKPVAKGYQKITPAEVDDGVTRVFANIKDLRSSVHGVLQWEWGNSGHNFSRFLVNSTLGVAGIFDVATHFKLRRTPEDFGLTFAQWGMPGGPYVVLPFLGPSNVRSSLGLIPDSALWAVSYIDHDRTRYSVTALYVIDLRADYLALEKGIVGDRYSFMRDAWLQSRHFKAGEQKEDDFGAGVDISDDDW